MICFTLQPQIPLHIIAQARHPPLKANRQQATSQACVTLHNLNRTEMAEPAHNFPKPAEASADAGRVIAVEPGTPTSTMVAVSLPSRSVSKKSHHLAKCTQLAACNARTCFENL
jgi:hypothetical protein